MPGQKNERRCIKSVWGQAAPDAAGSFSRPDLAIPRQVASQQRLTPFHQAPISIRKGDNPPRFDHGCSIRSAKARTEIPPVWANSSYSVDAVDRLRPTRTYPVNGVALSARNSHQTHQHLSLRGRAARGERGGRPAKEWFGSNRN